MDQKPANATPTITFAGSSWTTTGSDESGGSPFSDEQSIRELASLIGSSPLFGLRPQSLDSVISRHVGWCVIVQIVGIDFNYTLTNADLEKVFSRYGLLTAVEVLAPDVCLFHTIPIHPPFIVLSRTSLLCKPRRCSTCNQRFGSKVSRWCPRTTACCLG